MVTVVDMKICSVPECDRTPTCKGWCDKHYRRWLHHGDPNFVIVEQSRGLSVEDRFWMKVNKDGQIVGEELGQCWEWTAATSMSGYGRFRLENGKGRGSVEAYRVALLLAGVDVPKGYEPDHLCKNKLCVRISHMEIVPSKENNARGHRKLTEKQVLEIRNKYNNGVRKSDLAKEYNTAFMTITFIVRKETWKEL